jgi:hypothetical protein
MNATDSYSTLASSGTDALGAFIGGLFVALFLILAVKVGMRMMDRESARPKPEEQPHLPDTGPVYEVREIREPDEVPVAHEESERLMPYELHPAPTRRCEDQRPRRWSHQPGRMAGSGSA